MALKPFNSEKIGEANWGKTTMQGWAMKEIAIAVESPATPKVGIAGLLEGFLMEFAQLLEILLESIAILVVAIAVVIAIRRLFRHKTKGRGHHLQEQIRLEFGQTLALSLEFQLAADIVATAVSPTWEELAKLGAIAGIRTFLNFFLQREVQELQEITGEKPSEPNPEDV
ncbi:MAG: DUF1622 domain-containing protein [Leptolyngbyaceae cyanobacterium bins.302]|nr:DUF1622 domain-containing protein [Leptolyngbyaceae cyanobacterium bins.302]